MASLTPGFRFGPYQILAELGAGGMGVVYRARDSKLNRDVAIKVLLPAVASDPDRLARFSREAQVLALLNHPNIAHIYGVEDAGGVGALVMELVEGPTLADRIAEGAIPIDEALPIAKQITEALEAAHERGIIHRDLKPANIKVRTDGTVKVLDFGLAKAMDPAGTSSVNAMNSPTLTAATVHGVILGTAAYMSPEQAAGKPVDRRGDLWAFGVMLLEMLTGGQVFTGETVSHVLAAVLRAEPDWSGLPATTPHAIRRLLRRCLAKDRKRRLDSAADARLEIEDSLTGSSAADATQPGLAQHSAWSRALPWAVTSASALGMAVALWAPWQRAASSARPSELEGPISERLEIVLPPNAPLAPGGSLPDAADKPVLALSPDGSRLVYVAQLADHTQMFVRDMMTGNTTPLTGTDGGDTPFFSPDGASIAFFADGKLKTLLLGGGPPVALTDAPNAQGGVWATDGIYFNRNEGEGIFKVQVAGGSSEVVVAGTGILNPALFPPRGLIASRDGGIISIDQGQIHDLVRRGFAGRFVPTGHLVYAMPGRLLGVPLDRSHLRIQDSAVTLVSDLRTAPYGVAQFALSARGTLVYAAGIDQNTGSFVWVHRDGHLESLGLPEGSYFNFSVTPDGHRLAVTRSSESAQGGTDIWLYDLVSHSAPVRVSPRPPDGRLTQDRYPIWTADQQHIIYWHSDASNAGLMRASTERMGEAEAVWSRTPDGPVYLLPTSFSPDHAVLAAFGPTQTGKFGIYMVQLIDKNGIAAKTPVPQLWRRNEFNDAFAEFSPRGDAFAYMSDESGRYEIYVTSYPAPGPRCRVSKGEDPGWTPDGKAILIRSGVSIVAMDVKSIESCEIGTPRVLFSGAFPDRNGYGRDATADGRLLMMENKSILQPSQTLNVITNFFGELRRRVPIS